MAIGLEVVLKAASRWHHSTIKKEAKHSKSFRNSESLASAGLSLR